MERKLGRTMLAGAAFVAFLLFGLSGVGSGSSQAAQETPVRVTGDVKPPKIVKLVEPVYPEEARKQGIEGVVILEATVDVNGNVQDVKILRGVSGLSEAAIDAVKQWTYEPMIIEGTPKPAVFTVTVRFSLKDKAAKGGVEGGVAGGVAGGVEGGVKGGVQGGVVGGIAGTVRATGDIKPPKLVKKVEPVYPEEAKKQGTEGVVILEATIDVDGKVQSVKVLRGVSGLSEAAIEAVKQWVYEPMIIEGQPKPAVFTVTVNFSLKDKDGKLEAERTFTLD